ncbi:MAG: hypothetical protein ACLUUG_02375 [Lachnospiraceae bacterium]
MINMMETDIKQYIEERIPELNERLFPVLTTDISKLSVVYLFTDISSDHVKESQLTLNVIWSDYDECMEVHQKLKEILAMESDQAFVKYQDTYFHSELSSGGGTLFNDDLQMWEISKYYILNWR